MRALRDGERMTHRGLVTACTGLPSRKRSTGFLNPPAARRPTRRNDRAGSRRR
jgi:hypothetical protein